MYVHQIKEALHIKEEHTTMNLDQGFQINTIWSILNINQLYQLRHYYYHLTVCYKLVRVIHNTVLDRALLSACAYNSTGTNPAPPIN